MQIWIDQDECTGVGLCADLAPRSIAIGADGLAYVRDGEQILTAPRASAQIPAGTEDGVLEAVETCPVACIYVED